MERFGISFITTIKRFERNCDGSRWLLFLHPLHNGTTIVGFTATPDDHTLARFGEFSGYAESEKLWVPFGSYTMKEAIADGFILNPLKNIVPVASKMLFDLPSNLLEGFIEPSYKDADKKDIYENRDC